MNKDEKLAETFLKKCFNNISHEPDGNITPDFSIDSTIGVEVRRLNQQLKSKGLEESRIPLKNSIEKELSKYPKMKDRNCYFLSITFHREIGKIKQIKKKFHQAIEEFEKLGEKLPFSFKIDNNITLELIVQANNIKQKYLIGGISDLDSGGYVSVYYDEISNYIVEKSKKIEKHKHKYEIWWLLLVDHIGLIWSKDDICNILENQFNLLNFSKIIVINRKSELLFEII